MSDMVPTGSKYSDQERMSAATQYAITGLLTKTSKSTGIPETTLSSWTKSDWWVEAIAKVRSEKTEEHRARYSEILSLSQDRMVEDMPNATAQQASIIGGVAFDKLRLIDNQPTSISGKAESMSTLANEFRALSAKWEEKQSRVVSTQNDTQVIDK